MANKMSEKKKSASQSEMEEPKARVSERETKSAKASARVERSSRQPARRDTKAASVSAKKTGGFRNSKVVRFTRESYHELRYKVTWPTFLEARNMTITVVALSTVVGLVLGLVDAGLFQLFRLITGK
ncbi:MAG TPA: preprotein translocase subunit SecE [Ktedonobacteraceae bacterium]|nr:preprotein translocase subunit SecE [Ktedonobacteraceae bacterium]